MGTPHWKYRWSGGEKTYFLSRCSPWVWLYNPLPVSAPVGGCTTYCLPTDVAGELCALTHLLRFYRWVVREGGSLPRPSMDKGQVMIALDVPCRAVPAWPCRAVPRRAIGELFASSIMISHAVPCRAGLAVPCRAALRYGQCSLELGCMKGLQVACTSWTPSLSLAPSM